MEGQLSSSRNRGPITIGLLIAIGLERAIVKCPSPIPGAGNGSAAARKRALQNHHFSPWSILQRNRRRRTRGPDQHCRARSDAASAATRPPIFPVPLPTWIGYTPPDATWLMMRDSALLTVVPDLLVQNYWRVGGRNGHLSGANGTATRAGRSLRRSCGRIAKSVYYRHHSANLSSAHSTIMTRPWCATARSLSTSTRSTPWR